MEFEKQSLLREYALDNAAKTLELGYKLCKWGLPLAVIITVVETWTYRNPGFLLSRLLFIIPAFAYIVLILSPLKHRTRLAMYFHLVTITGGLLMMALLSVLKLNQTGIHPAFKMASATGGLVVIIFVAYYFSGGTKKYVRYILALTIGLLLLYVSRLPGLAWSELTMFINPLVAALSIIVLSVHDERDSYQDFKYRKVIELQKLKLQQEIEERKILEQRLQKQLEEDYLTGAYNRRAAFSLLDGYINSNQPFSLCYIDIDNFKTYNDSYGHSIGDLLLVAFAEYLKESIRKTDSLCRIGGDEFLVILPGCQPVEAKSIIDRIHHKTLDNSLVNDIRLDFSYGFSHYYQGSVNNPYQLMELADRNMYDYKTEKMNRT